VRNCRVIRAGLQTIGILFAYGIFSSAPSAPVQAAPPHKQPPPGKPAKSAKASNTAKPNYKHPLELVGKVQGSGWYLPWYKRDPRNPNGKRIPVLIAQAKTGEIVRRNNEPEIVMYTVHAKLFQKGVHAADLDAGKIRANQRDERIFGSGGCKVVSLLNPADTVLTADKITWDARKSLFTADGNAHIVRQPKNGGVPVSQEGGRIVFDLVHNTFTVQ
jgi:hypothetical protein